MDYDGIQICIDSSLTAVSLIGLSWISSSYARSQTTEGDVKAVATAVGWRCVSDEAASIEWQCLIRNLCVSIDPHYSLSKARHCYLLQ